MMGAIHAIADKPRLVPILITRFRSNNRQFLTETSSIDLVKCHIWATPSDGVYPRSRGDQERERGRSGDHPKETTYIGDKTGVVQNTRSVRAEVLRVATEVGR